MAPHRRNLSFQGYHRLSLQLGHLCPRSWGFPQRCRRSCKSCHLPFLVSKLTTITSISVRVHDFFDFVHYSIPLFWKEDFLQQYEGGTINRSLLLTVLAVTAKSLGLPHGWQVANIDDCLQQLLKTDPLDAPTQPALLLDAFR